jgi:hypothetical protein
MTHIVDTPLAGDKVTEKGIPTAQFQSLLESIELAINNLAAPSYTVATVPDATKSESNMVYVSDEAGGATIAFSDGTSWRRCQDRNIIS